jgi:hypothetical protein
MSNHIQEAEQVFKLSPEARAAETERVFAAIVEEERRARIEKNIRLRSLRLMRQ